MTPSASRLARPATPAQALRLVAAVLTVTVALLLGAVGSRDEAAPAYHHYVALGDSYTAAPFVPLNDVAYGCNRSSNNYPHLVASALHIGDLVDRSCSGAQTRHLLQGQTTVRDMEVPPQLADLSPKTDLVTVGLGVNNHHLYARLATVCRLSKRTCRLYDQRATLSSIVDLVRPALVEGLDQIRRRAPKARVLLVGYPKLLPQRGNCARLPSMRPQDRLTFRRINLRLREEMRAAAREADVEFVDFYAASIGHDVCSRHPWVQGRVGNRRQGAALHPLPSGQTALARLLETTLRAEALVNRGYGRLSSSAPVSNRP